MDAPHAKVESAEDYLPGETHVERRERLRNDPDREARWAAWRKENAASIESWNNWIEEHGLPLERYRSF